MQERRFDITELQPWIEMKFDRSGGPGGQNVNKTNTRATLLFDFENCPLLSDEERNRIRRRLEERFSQDGRLRIVSQAGRTQPANRAAAEIRLLELLAAALYVPKTRHATRPTRASQKRRVRTKQQRGALKRTRQRNPGAED